MSKPVPDEYLGDGVYASYDGYHVWLDLRAQDSTTRIALEPAVMDALLRYSRRAWPAPTSEPAALDRREIPPEVEARSMLDPEWEP